jgi:VanZ family protein
MKWSPALALYLFWPALVLVMWGELTPHPPDLEAHVWDKLLHFTAYFGLSAMAAVALRARSQALWTTLALILFGGILEVLQGFTGRDPSFYDELANTLGAVSGAGFGWALIKLLQPRILKGLTPGQN